jgi:hypothetical protein
MSEHHQETDSDAYTEHDNLNAPGRSKHLKYVVLGSGPMPRRCPECKLAAPRAETFRAAPSGRRILTADDCAPSLSNPAYCFCAVWAPGGPGSGSRHVRAHWFGHAHLPNSGRCLLGYLCTTQRIHSWVQPAPSGLGGVSARRLLCPPRRSQIDYALAADGEIAVAGSRVTAASGTARGLRTLAYLASATAGTRGEPVLTMILVEPEAVAAARTIQCPGCVSARSCLWQRGAGAPGGLGAAWSGRCGWLRAGRGLSPPTAPNRLAMV